MMTPMFLMDGEKIKKGVNSKFIDEYDTVVHKNPSHYNDFPTMMTKLTKHDVQEPKVEKFSVTDGFTDMNCPMIYFLLTVDPL